MRSCIFCEGKATTNEDAWPLWLMRRLGGTEAGRIEGQRGKQAPKTWQVRKTGLKVRFVCATCNSGWMSRLENRVKPIVERFFREEPVILEDNDQTTLATWAGKNAMVYEALRSESEWFYANSERETLRKSLQLPLWTSIWIAKCVEYPGICCKTSDLDGITDVSENHFKTYVTTMGFGPLAIQVMSSKLPNLISATTRVVMKQRPGPWDQLTLQIWPIQSNHITWPSSMGLSSELGLDAFSERWSPITG